LTCVILYIE